MKLEKLSTVFGEDPLPQENVVNDDDICIENSIDRNWLQGNF